MPQERDFPSRRILTGKVGRGLAGFFIFASGCTPGLPEPDSSEDFKGNQKEWQIPAHIRGQLPEAIARATEEARRPKQEFKEASLNDIKIVKPLFSRCSPHPNDDPRGEDLWGVWLVRFENPNFHLKRGSFELEARTPSGSVIRREKLIDVGLSPQTLDYIPAFIEPGPKARSMFGATPTNYISGKGSRLESVHLSTKNSPAEWARVDDSPKQYIYEQRLGETGFIDVTKNLRTSPSRDLYLYPRGFMPRSFSIMFQNKGERAINGVGVFGVLLDANGELADLLQGEVSQVAYGRNINIQANSLSNTGRCAKLELPGKVELLYWVSFLTHTGMPVIVQESVKLSNWGNSIK